MHHKTRTSLCNGVLLAMLAIFVVGLFALVWSGLPSPRLPDEPNSVAVAHGSLPPVTYTIRQSETRNAQMLQAAFDRIGFDLDAVSQGYMSVPRVLLASLPPDLDRLDAMESRRVLFLRTLLPVILHVNDQIGAERQRLLVIRGQMARGDTLSADDVQWILSLADAYDQPDSDVDALLKKVDVIPPSLALAQAIEESGWGTSRIAREQNAIFGQSQHSPRLPRVSSGPCPHADDQRRDRLGGIGRHIASLFGTRRRVCDDTQVDHSRQHP
jgi:hypothetical protein